MKEIIVISGVSHLEKKPNARERLETGVQLRHSRMTYFSATSAAGQFLGCKMAERRTEREDSEMSDFADSSQASGHNQDVETNDEFSDKVVEGKLLKYSSPNKI